MSDFLAALSEHYDREPVARLVEDEPDAGVWEPPGVPTFKPGDRIQVRANLECRYCFDPRFPTCYERALADDGRTGTVSDVGHDWCSCRYDDEPPTADHLGHTVLVTWDERREYDDPAIEGVDFDAHFAPSELALLPPAPERGAVGGGEEGDSHA